MNAPTILVKIILMSLFLMYNRLNRINSLYFNEPRHNYKKNLNTKGHFAYFYPESVLAKHLNV